MLMIMGSGWWWCHSVMRGQDSLSLSSSRWTSSVFSSTGSDIGFKKRQKQSATWGIDYDHIHLSSLISMDAFISQFASKLKWFSSPSHEYCLLPLFGSFFFLIFHFVSKCVREIFSAEAKNFLLSSLHLNPSVQYVYIVSTSSGLSPDLFPRISSAASHSSYRSTPSPVMREIWRIQEKKSFIFTAPDHDDLSSIPDV